MSVTPELRATLDPARKSWLDTANDAACDFPIQNLPFGMFSDARNPSRRVGVALGDQIVDLAELQRAGLLTLPLASADDYIAMRGRAFEQPTLNDFIALGRDAWRSVRVQLSELFSRDTARLRDDAALRAKVLVAQRDATLYLPVEIPGYTDFYSSKEHATHVGSMFRDPKNALLPNWSEMPIGYNGRASSVIVSGTPVRRPNGQLKLPDQDRPVFGACRKLDIELETGFIVGKGNALGEPIACEDAEAHIFGMVLLNDWSARDIQQWEYVPLGPFNAKTFATTISPWIVTLDALEPFRTAQPEQSPQPLAYLRHAGAHAFDIALEVTLLPEAAQRVLGEPNATALLAYDIHLEEGFEPDRFVDIFDAGPVLTAQIDRTACVRHGAERVVREAAHQQGDVAYMVSSGSGETFRCVLADLPGDAFAGAPLAGDVRAALNVKDGDVVRCVPLHQRDDEESKGDAA